VIAGPDPESSSHFSPEKDEHDEWNAGHCGEREEDFHYCIDSLDARAAAMMKAKISPAMRMCIQ
jgi:hypothetical protein